VRSLTWDSTSNIEALSSQQVFSFCALCILPTLPSGMDGSVLEPAPFSHAFKDSALHCTYCCARPVLHSMLCGVCLLAASPPSLRPDVPCVLSPLHSCIIVCSAFPTSASLWLGRQCDRISFCFRESGYSRSVWAERRFESRTQFHWVGILAMYCRTFRCSPCSHDHE
jgi:hypothetical protein